MDSTDTRQPPRNKTRLIIGSIFAFLWIIPSVFVVFISSMLFLPIIGLLTLIGLWKHIDIQASDIIMAFFSPAWQYALILFFTFRKNNFSRWPAIAIGLAYILSVLALYFGFLRYS